MSVRSFFSEQTSPFICDKKISIVIPWRETESRIQGFKLLVENYKKVLEGVEIITCDSGSEVFNLSASRNVGLLQAFTSGSEAVVLSDADVFVSADALIESIHNSLNKGVITNPYTVYCELTERSTEMLFNRDEDCINHYLWKREVQKLVLGKIAAPCPCSGINIIPKSVWDKIGGFDENFVGWGFEDIAYLYTYANEYKDTYNFTEGLALSIYHKKEWKDNINNGSYFISTYGNRGLIV
jgi:predicted glycosyltransferase involved in capsule biosynthesis